MAALQKSVDIKKLDWFTLQQAGEMLQISAKTVQRRCEDGTIKGTKIGIKWRISKTALDKLAQGR
jgi:excisionase family DNA binding protein